MTNSIAFTIILVVTLVVSSNGQIQQEDPAATALATTGEPTFVHLDDIHKQDANTMGLLSIPDGGTMGRCKSTGSVYLTLPNSRDNLNVIFKDPRDAPKSAADAIIQVAKHEVLDNVFPAVGLIFANMSDTADETKFRIYALNLLDVISQSDQSAWGIDDKSTVYRVEVTNVTETVGNVTSEWTPDEVFSAGRVSFPSGTLMYDLIDYDDDTIDEERRQYTIAHLINNRQLVHNSNRFAAMMNGADRVGAQGVMTLWLLGPLSIPLYPIFIACCSVAIWFWYTIQPFLFCCVI